MFAPALPKTSKAERSIVLHADEIRLLCFAAGLLPFVEAVCRNETASTAEGIAERWLFGSRFGARIDHLAADLGIFGPARD
jgi:hypothetical protein